MKQGVLDFLTSQAPEARLLRSRFVFKIVPCLNPDAYFNFNDLDCGCSISLTFPMGVWLDPNAAIQAAVVNVTGRHSNPRARTDRLIPCLLVRR